MRQENKNLTFSSIGALAGMVRVRIKSKMKRRLLMDVQKGSEKNRWRMRRDRR
jgi:hypothetical protein